MSLNAGLTRPRVFGQYQLEGLLGRGGMGLVYRARQSRADRFVAIKISNCGQFSPGMRDQIRQRFETEMRAAARLSHEIAHHPVAFFKGPARGAASFGERMKSQFH